MTHGKTYNKSPRRINHKATKSKTNTGTTALERSVEQTTGEGGGGVKALLQLANFTLGPDATLNTETHKNSNKRTKSTKICSLFPKRGNRNTKRTENTRTNKMTQGKTQNKQGPQLHPFVHHMSQKKMFQRLVFTEDLRLKLCIV